MKYPEDQIAWYAMRVSYCREMLVKKYLDAASITNFVPMRWATVQQKGCSRKILEPIIHNLLFIRESKLCIDRLKSTVLQSLRYIMHSEGGAKYPIVVADEDMARFIAVSNTNDEKLLYLQPEDLVQFEHGDRVRITGGVFEGVEGICQKINGSKYRRVIVNIEGVVGMAILGIHPILLEKIDASAG